MPAAPKREPAADFFKRVNDMAASLFDDNEEDDKTKYINDHMARAGYKPVTQWLDADEGDGKDSGRSGFPSRKNRDAGGTSGTSRRFEGGGGWF